MWCGVMWRVVAWCDVAWCGVAWRGFTVQQKFYSTLYYIHTTPHYTTLHTTHSAYNTAHKTDM